MTEEKTLPIELLKVGGYFADYHDEYSTSSCQREAWQRVERKIWTNFGVRRYTTFESFKKGLSCSRWLIENEKRRILASDPCE
jgi:ribosomal protein L37AE/L43A